MIHEPLAERLSSFGWHVIQCDGNNMDALDAAFTEAKTVKGKPSVIIAETVKGCGSSIMENKAAWHHKVPNAEEARQIKADLLARKEALLHA